MIAELYCCSCKKPHAEIVRFVSLDGKQVICNECIDLCAEIVHEGEELVSVRADELAALRAKVNQAELANIWIRAVREAVSRADETMQRTDAT